MTRQIETIKQLAQWAWNRTSEERNNQAIVVIIGDTGIGKSSLALCLADEIEGWKQGNFDVARQVVRTKEEWDAARRLLGPRKVIIDDESVKTGSNRLRVMSGANVDKMTSFNTKRKLRQVLIVIIPFADDLDKKQFKHADWVLQVTERGKGQAYEVMTFGLQKTGIWWEPRFPFQFPDCAVVRPDLWVPYNKTAIDDELGVARQSIEEEERIHRYAELARRIMTTA